MRDNRHTKYRPPIRTLSHLVRHFPRAIALWQELSSLLVRIRTIWSSKKKLGINMGPHFERRSDGSVQICIRTQRRIQDIEKVFQSQGWGTILDRQLFLLGWDAGFQFQSHPERNSVSPNISGCSEAASEILQNAQMHLAKRWTENKYARSLLSFAWYCVAYGLTDDQCARLLKQVIDSKREEDRENEAEMIAISQHMHAERQKFYTERADRILGKSSSFPPSPVAQPDDSQK